MTTMHRSAFSTPRQHPSYPGLRYHLYDVVVDGIHMGQMQYHPHRRKWRCVRFSDGQQSYKRNRLVAHEWITK
jgi:predicted RNA-binding protein with PUA domain